MCYFREVCYLFYEMLCNKTLAFGHKPRAVNVPNWKHKSVETTLFKRVAALRFSGASAYAALYFCKGYSYCTFVFAVYMAPRPHMLAGLYGIISTLRSVLTVSSVRLDMSASADLKLR